MKERDIAAEICAVVQESFDLDEWRSDWSIREQAYLPSNTLELKAGADVYLVTVQRQTNGSVST